MKIWIKVIIVGIIIFFVGVFYTTAMGGLKTGSGGFVIATVGIILVVVGVLSGLTRGFRHMMNE